MRDTVFISDLHLLPERAETLELFIKFTHEIAAQADCLYILGDFLELWWGDDEPAPGYQKMFDRLSELATDDKTDIFLKIKLQGREALLMHGDTLCIDDIEYQKFRLMARNPAWQQQLLAKSLEERYAIAQSIRDSSKQETSEKDESIMDVNQDETDSVFIKNDVDLIIHGHTHRPMIHHKEVDGRETTRVVLGDWHASGSYKKIHISLINKRLRTFPYRKLTITFWQFKFT